MKGFLAFISIFCIVSFSGCALNQSFVLSVSNYTDTILPEYRKYIEKDTSLTENSKRIRKQTADKFQELVDDAIEGASK